MRTKQSLFYLKMPASYCSSVDIQFLNSLCHSVPTFGLGLHVPFYATIHYFSYKPISVVSMMCVCQFLVI